MTALAKNRSYYFVPGDDEEAITEGRASAADGIILDLEDAVGPDAKDRARRVTAAALEDAGEAAVTHVVRTNGLDTTWGTTDLEAVLERSRPPDAVILPDVRSASDIGVVADAIRDAGADVAVIPLIERPDAVFAVRDVATADPAVGALAFGHGDFERHLGTLAQSSSVDLTGPRLRVSMAASAADVPVIDTPYVERDELDGLWSEAAEAKRLGFDGKMTFLRDQIAVINETFTPSSEAVETSERIVQAYEDAGDEAGVVYVDGEFVDEPVVAAHRERLAAARELSEADR